MENGEWRIALSMREMASFSIFSFNDLVSLTRYTDECNKQVKCADAVCNIQINELRDTGMSRPA